jgi:hypothetical protein
MLLAPTRPSSCGLTINTTNAVDDSFEGCIDETIMGNVLSNDSDIDGDAQTVTTTLVSVTLDPPSLPGDDVSIDMNTGVFEYTPPVGFFWNNYL